VSGADDALEHPGEARGEESCPARGQDGSRRRTSLAPSRRADASRPLLESSSGPHEAPSKQPIHSPNTFKSDVQQTPGRLSNPAPATATPPQSPRPVQRRLTPSDVDDIRASYITGQTITELAETYGVNRTTIMRHLHQHGVRRRRVARKMTDAQVGQAAATYLVGHSLATVANDFNVAVRTLSREFRKAGIPIRPRQGWTY